MANIGSIAKGRKDPFPHPVKGERQPSGSAPVSPPGRHLWGHPRGFYFLLLTEMCERFSYFGARFILYAFLKSSLEKGGFGWSKSYAFTTAGLFVMLVFLSGIPGGKLAEYWLGRRYSVLCGGVLQGIGYFLLSLIQLPAFFLGLALVILGTGLVHSSMAELLGELYPKGSAERDQGYTFFHISINIGSLTASAVVCTVAEKYGAWQYGFLLTALGVGCALVFFLAGWQHIPEPALGLFPDAGQERRFRQRVMAGLAGMLGAGGLFAYGLCHPAWGVTRFVTAHYQPLCNVLAGMLGISMIGFLGYHAWQAEGAKERRQIGVFSFGLALVFLFYASFEQPASSIMSFIEQGGFDTFFCGIKWEKTVLQGLNPLFVLLLAYGMTRFWRAVRQRYPRVNHSAQMALAVLVLGFGFICMIGASRISEADMQASLVWLIATQFFLTLAEVSFVPAMLGFTTSIVPPSIYKQALALLFSVVGLATYAAMQLGAMAEGIAYTRIFAWAGALPMALACLFLLGNEKMRTLLPGDEGQAG